VTRLVIFEGEDLPFICGASHVRFFWNSWACDKKVWEAL